MTNPTALPAWKSLQAHHAEIDAALDMRDLFRDDPTRFQTFSRSFGDILLDFSKNRITAKTFGLLDRPGQTGRRARLGREDVHRREDQHQRGPSRPAHRVAEPEQPPRTSWTART